MTCIPVEINDIDVIAHSGKGTFETYLNGKLREAGIPVIGTLKYEGISRGKLTCIDFTHKHIKKFIWNEEG